MSCSCATNNLRLFVRSVARLELGLDKQNTRISSPTSGSKRAYHQYPRTSFSTFSRAAAGNDAFMEITPDAIDALAAEARQSSYYESSAADQEGFKISRDNAAADGPVTSTGRVRATRSRGDGERYSTEKSFKSNFPSKATAWRETPSGWRPLARDAKPPLSYKEKGEQKQAARPPPEKRDREYWQIQKAALKAKFGDEAWNPRKRLSPDALAGIRAVHNQFPDEYPTEVLAAKFEVSPEMIRRILKSKWKPSADEEMDRQQRWFKRGESVWKHYAETGMKPPKRWREAGVQGEIGYMAKKKMRARGELQGFGDVPGWKPEEVPQVITTERRAPMGSGRAIDFV